MGIKIKLLAFAIGIVFFSFILRNIKRNSMSPSYAVLWTAISLFLVSIPVFEPFYHWVASSLIGIVDARHVIYIVLIGFLLVYTFYLTIKISKMSDRIQWLISHTAVMETEREKDKS